VVDASVCAKWYLDEEYSDRARLLRDEFVKGQIAITVPSLLFYETLNALRYSRAFDEKELPVVADSLYDAAYVALSEHLRALFYTVDKKLLDRFPRRARHIRIFKEQASS